MNRLVIATIAFLSIIPLAAAEMPHRYHNQQDQVVLNLTTEGWVKTDTARVSEPLVRQCGGPHSGGEARRAAGPRERDEQPGL